MVVQDEFIATAHRIVWCGVATVDRRGRPRSRILHPLWERAGDGVRGWVVTRKSPLKAAHLEHTPYLSCTYWDATHDVAIADCHAGWEEDRDEHARVWALYARAPAPLGYDFHAIWPDGPASEGAALLHLEPWRLHVADATSVTSPRIWRPDTEYR